MLRTVHAARVALVAAAGALGVVGAPSNAAAQRPRIAVAHPAPPSPPNITPYGSASAAIDPGDYGRQGGRGAVHSPGRQGGRSALRPGVIYHHPVPGVYAVYPAYPYHPSGGYGGQVYDATGRPLYGADDWRGASGYERHMGGPDLSGSPYAVVEGGAMIVDFGNGDRRTIPSCSALDAARTPDGRARTTFYRPPADAFILRAGARGRVLGTPPAGARVCYTVDRYGREALAY